MSSIDSHDAIRLVRSPAIPVRLHKRTPDARLASVLARLTAALVDALATVGAAMPALGLCTAAELTGPSAAFLVGVCVFLLLIVQWFLIATTGQSLGKRWLGIRIVRHDGGPAGFVHGVVLRSWVLQAPMWLPWIGSFIALLDVLMIFGTQRRCMHDHIAGTKVIVS